MNLLFWVRLYKTYAPFIPDLYRLCYDAMLIYVVSITLHGLYGYGGSNLRGTVANGEI